MSKVHLEYVPDGKIISAIKTVRSFTGLDLKGAKAVLDRRPVTFEVRQTAWHGGSGSASECVREFREIGCTAFEVEPAGVKVELCVQIDSDGKWYGLGWGGPGWKRGDGEPQEAGRGEILAHGDWDEVPQGAVKHKVWVTAYVPLPPDPLEAAGSAE